MLDWILFIIGLIYFDYSLNNPIGFLWNDHVYTRKGLIQIPGNQLGRFLGIVIVLRSDCDVRIIRLLGSKKYNIVIPRTLNSSVYRITYLIDEKETVCPYELGPNLVLSKGCFVASSRSKGTFGSRWSPVAKSNVWPIFKK